MTDTNESSNRNNSSSPDAGASGPASSPPAAMPASTVRNPLLLGSYGLILAVWAASQVILVPYVVHLMLLVTAILYAACHHSLVLLQSPQPSKDAKEGDAPQQAQRETLQKEDAYQFPIVGSVSLFSLYLAIRFLGQDVVNLLIGVYFGMVGLGAVTLTLTPLVQAAVDRGALPIDASKSFQIDIPLQWMDALPSFLQIVEFDEGEEHVWSIKFNMVDIAASVLAAALVASYYASGKYWALNNVLGICFCLQGIERFSLGTYTIAAILLAGLFLYDIFWVFGTDVMVTVAKNIDGPIKLLFPRTLQRNPDTGKLAQGLSLLGLGDIVIPGFFLALMLRFDAHRAGGGAKDALDFRPDSHFAKPYFHATLVAYVAGLAMTLFVMMYFEAAQPALLYLVPACLGSSFAVAASRGEIKELLAYSEEEEDKEKEEDESGESKESSSSEADNKPIEAKKDD